MKVHSKAPGKLMLAGEYSVLFGGLGLVWAIDKTALGNFCAGPDLTFSYTTGLAPIRDDQHPIFRCVLESCRFFGLTPKTGAYFIDTSAFYVNGRKLGLGSSAAATVCLTQMFLKEHGIHEPDMLFKMAQKAHKDFSHGLGSGADIACSVYKDLISIENCDKTPAVQKIKNDLTKDLIFINTNRAQDTRELVKVVSDYAYHESNFINAFKSQSTILVNQWLSLKNREAEKLITIIENLYALLDSLGSQLGADIISKEHQQINLLAKKFAGSAKPSGAGGGDVALAIVPTHNQAEFLNAIRSIGFESVSFNNYTP